MINCCAIIVTYANRFDFLKQVILSCLEEGVKKIIIVDNNSAKESKISLKKFLENYTEVVDVIWNKDNVGSGVAYRQGLERAFEDKTCDYIWLLDDDNKPNSGALEILWDYWQRKPQEVACLLSYRKDRKMFEKAVIDGNPDLVLGEKNSFLSFHIKNLLGKLFKRFFLSTEKEKPNAKIEAGWVKVAPYGGMFFHKKLLEKIGYPREDFFLYADDHEWSYRISKADYKIELVLKSRIEDLETSWNVSKKRQIIFKSMALANPLRIYYSTRNRIVFEEDNLVIHRFVYFINKKIFMCIFFFYSFGKFDRYKAFLRGVNDAKHFDLRGRK